MAFLLGVVIVTATLVSAVKTLVLPRSAPDQLTRLVFITIRRLFTIRLRWAKSYSERDRIMAFFAPVSLLALVPAWLTFVMLGYSCMYWALEAGSAYSALRVSGSSVLTLGFTATEGLAMTILEFSEAAIGLILVALLIAYLPTMYAAFSRRETAVTMLEVRAGSPPSAIEMILRYNRIHGLDRLTEQWKIWEAWFADIEESHTSLPALCFFRSPRPEHSWVTAAGAVLDTASLTLSAVEIPNDPQAALCIRAGFLALRHIADFFSIPYNKEPFFPSDPISITREEFDAACEQLASKGVPLKSDRQQAWRDFAGWRVNYDTVLLILARMTLAPEAPWSSDRIVANAMPAFFARK